MPTYYLVAADGWKWRVADEWRASFESGPFARFEELLRTGRPIKDLNIKRTVEVRAEGREFLVKIYKRRGGLQGLRPVLRGSRPAREHQRAFGGLSGSGHAPTLVAVGGL